MQQWSRLLGREAKFRRMSQSPKSKYYFVHVLWKVSDLNPLLHQLVHTCKNLLTGIADFENFVEEVAFALEWSINNCANTTNASIARDKLKKHLNSFLSVNENQNDVGDKQSFRTPSVAYPADWSDESSRYDFVEKMRNGKCEVEKMYQTLRMMSKMKESESGEDAQRSLLVESEKESGLQTPCVMVKGSEQNDRSNGTRNLAIVAHRKYGGFDFLRRLFTRRKKGRSKGRKLLGKA
ncbi:unnamed protein product [Vicia faba]|uniref:Uncharacterized protein n=1 Tax=Vicia faba TaxID=3906 RepID=A0AAV1AP97_VICFA|nr:unnamed protein product [Vicia faba]